MRQPATPRLLFLNQRKILFQRRVSLNIPTSGAGRLNAPSISTVRLPPGKTSVTSYLHNKPFGGGIPDNAPTQSKVCEPPRGPARASLFAADDGSGMDRLVLRLQHALLPRAEGGRGLMMNTCDKINNTHTGHCLACSSQWSPTIQEAPPPSVNVWQ